MFQPLTVEVDGNVYQEEVIVATLYRLARRITGELRKNEAGRYSVTLRLKDGSDDLNERECRDLFWDALNDDFLRRRVREETKTIRELILAHAFAGTGLASPDGVDTK